MAAKTILSEETITKVVRQVEFYFSDSNLPRDNFLMTTIGESEDGMVSLALICSFSRMRSHLGLGDVKADGVPEDTVQAVADTLRPSDFLKISEDGTKVGRRTPLSKPEEVIEQVDSRTVAASPLAYDVKLEHVETFFTQFGKVNSVRLPKHVAGKNVFCGTALIEFSTEEDAEKLLTQTLAFAGVDLEFKPKKDFDAEREKQVKEFEKTRGQGNRKEADEEKYSKGLIVAFKLKKKSSDGESKQNGAQEQATEVKAPKTEGESMEIAPEEASKVSETPKDDSEIKTEVVTDEVTPDKEVKESEEVEKSSESADKNDGEKAEEKKAPLASSFKDNMDVVMREDLKAVFSKFGTVKFIDFKMGEESGYIRFEEPEASQKARAAAVLNEEGGLLVKNFILPLEALSGDAEKEYWNVLLENQKSYKGSRGGRGGRFNRGGGGGRRGSRFRNDRNDGSHSGRPNKVQRVNA